MKACKDIRKTIIQVVGHTQVEVIDPGKATGGRYYFIDSMQTSKQYLVYEDKQITINQLTNENVNQ